MGDDRPGGRGATGLTGAHPAADRFVRAGDTGRPGRAARHLAGTPRDAQEPGAVRRRAPGSGRWVPVGDRRAQANEPPHAHELPAFGLSIVKPCFSMVSAKSIFAPSR